MAPREELLSCGDLHGENPEALDFSGLYYNQKDKLSVYVYIHTHITHMCIYIYIYIYIHTYMCAHIDTGT